MSNQALDPEEFRNYEFGAKWDVVPDFSLTAALSADRGNVVVPDPVDAALSLLVDAQRTKGFELGLNGYLTRAWNIAGGYAYQDGVITQSISATAQAGAVLAQLPKHSLSLWNKYDFTPRVAAAIGLLSRDDVFAATDNSYLAGLDAGGRGRLFQRDGQGSCAGEHRKPFDKDYYLNAHSNTNITPGSPRAVRFALTTRF